MTANDGEHGAVAAEAVTSIFQQAQQAAAITDQFQKSLKPMDLGGFFGSGVLKAFELPESFPTSSALSTLLADPIEYEHLDFEPDPTPGVIAQNTGLVADAVRELVALTAASLAVTKQQHEQLEQIERFTRRMTWASLIIAGASLAASIAAVVVSLILR